MPTLTQELSAVPAAKAPERPAIDVLELLNRVTQRYRHLPGTTPPDALVPIELYPHEWAYLRKLLKNHKLDDIRKNQAYRKRHPSLDSLLEDSRKAEEEGRKPDFVEPPTPGDDPELTMEQAERQSQFQQALLELPTQLAVIVHALPAVGGNVSELARRLGRPQRQVARQVERIQKHFAAKNLRS